MSRWGVASGGCKLDVKELPLKGTGETRCRPSRRRAWLRGDRVSPNEVSFNLREIAPRSRNILHSWKIDAPAETGLRTSWKIMSIATGYRDWTRASTSQTVSSDYLNYSDDVRDTAKSRMGCWGNHHLNHLAEFIFVNVGGSDRNGKERSPLRTGMSVGGIIVVGARETAYMAKDARGSTLFKESRRSQMNFWL